MNTPEKPTEKTEFEKAADGQHMSIFQEFWHFILQEKTWWMVPILIVLALLGLLVALSATGAAPFIYTLF